ncbi:uncharacterized protein LOC144565593 [Carex rostrata]
MVKQKVVIKLSLENARKRKKALTTAAGMNGITSTSIDDDKIVIEGDGMDLVALTTVLRKKLGYAELISLTTGDDKKEAKKEEKAGDSAKPGVIPYHYPIHYPYPYRYAACHEDSQDSCSIIEESKFIMVKQKVVIQLSMENARKRTKALTAVVGVDGILSTSIDGDKIVVEGDGIDSVALITVLRKKLGYAVLISVTSGENKKEEKKEDKSAEPVVIPYQYAVHPVYPYQYAYHQVSQYPDSCSIMKQKRIKIG